MELSEFQKEVKGWADHNFPDGEPWEPLVGAMEELGELSHAHLKEHQSIRIETNYFLDKQDAIGDIIVYLADYCNRNGLDLEWCVSSAWKVASSRDWIKYPEDGVSK